MTPARIVTLVSIGVLMWAFVFSFFIFEPGAIAGNEHIANSQHSFTAKVLEVDKRNNKTFLVVSSSELTQHKIRLTTDGFRNFRAGQLMYVTGTIKVPENFADFNYQGWLAKDNIAYVIFRPNIEPVSEGAESFAAKTKKALALGIDNSLLPPHSSLYSAMLLDDTGELTQQNRDVLSSSGLAHIVAISGTHITIITMLLISAGLYFGLWRHQASWIALAIIIFYIWMIGAPASAVRVGIMASTVFLAERFGRPGSSWRALLLAAAVMLALNPLLIRYDVGFQLSFLAVTGILIFARRIELYITKFPNVLHAREVLAMTLSAQIFTAPLVLFTFGTFAPLAPIANVLVATFAPVILIAGFIAAFFGILGGVFASIGALPAWAFSVYFWTIASLFS